MDTDYVGRLTVPKRVVRFLKACQPEAYCDDCLASALSLRRSQVNLVTSTLGLCREYFRGSEPCFGCGGKAKVTISHRRG
jgi:hypothetical protein